MPGKNRPNHEKMLRLKRAARTLVHKKLEELRQQKFLASAVVVKKTSEKIGRRNSWASDADDRQKQISLLRATIRELDAEVGLQSAYLDYAKQFGTLIRFSGKKKKSAKQNLNAAIKERHLRRQQTAELVWKHRQRKVLWKHAMDSLVTWIKKSSKRKAKFLGARKKMLYETKVAGANLKKLRKELGILLGDFISKKLTMGTFEERKKSLLWSINKCMFAIAETQEAYYIMLSRHARLFAKTIEFIPEDFLFELARRRHNATEQKIKAKKWLDRNAA